MTPTVTGHGLVPAARANRFLGLQAGATPASLIVAQGVVVVVLATAFVRAVDGRIRPSRAALRYAPRAAIVLAFAFAFLVESLARGEASVVVPIVQMGFVVTALLGFLFLREPFTARKGAGLAPRSRRWRASPQDSGRATNTGLVGPDLAARRGMIR